MAPNYYSFDLLYQHTSVFYLYPHGYLIYLNLTVLLSLLIYYTIENLEPTIKMKILNTSEERYKLQCLESVTSVFIYTEAFGAQYSLLGA